ncbi:MAG: DUF444 family protein [Thiolinea sp.]
MNGISTAPQASDGDNWQEDNERCPQRLTKAILPMVRYFTIKSVIANRRGCGDCMST